MKRYFFSITLTSIILSSFVGCTSTSVASIVPSEINYKEISAKDYINTKESDLYLTEKGYKISDVFILDAETKTENGQVEGLLGIGASKNAWNSFVYVYATDFITTKNQTDPGWLDRIDSVQNNENFNGHYTFYVYAKQVGDFYFGYYTKIIVYDIEGIPSQEQIDASKEAAKMELLAQEEAENKERAEKLANLDEAGKILAEGYVYHGVEEVSRNCKLFANGALEEGHAYYISGFIVKYGGSMAKIEYGDGFFFSSQSSPIPVDYVSQKIKGDVVEAGVTNLFGQTIENPITVVIAGGKGYAHIPVVLGIIEE